MKNLERAEADFLDSVSALSELCVKQARWHSELCEKSTKDIEAAFQHSGLCAKFIELFDSLNSSYVE